MRILNAPMVVAALGALLWASTGRADEENLPIDKLPKAVVDAVKAKYADAKLVSAEKETKGDRTFYEVVIKNKEQTIELLLTPEGKIVEIEQPIAPKDLPKKVADAIGKKFPKGTVKSVEEVTKDETKTYAVLLENEVMIDKEKQKVQLQLTAGGQITASQALIAARDLPQAVTEALEKKYPKSTIVRANEIRKQDKVTYLAILHSADKKIAASLESDGKFIWEQVHDKKEKKDKK